MGTIVELPRLPVMCTTAICGPEGIQAAMDIVEEKLNKNLRGRKCYGVITQDNGTMNYRACVVIREGDDPKELELEETEIPAGRYARERLSNFDYRTDVPKLIQTFEKLAEDNEVDESRPSLEFYRRHDEILVHVPIK